MRGIRRLRATVAVLALGCVVSPALVRADADTTPPVLVALSLPAQALTGASGGTVALSAQITDDLSGVAFAGRAGCALANVSGIALRGPGGAVLAGDSFDFVAGNAYAAQVRLPPFAPEGMWTVDHVELVDCAGNFRTVDTRALTTAGFPTTLEVKGIGDSTPPVLRTLSIRPAIADNAAGPAAMTVEAEIT